MVYDYLKSLHLIFVVTWFAGLFYIVRLFVYQVEAQTKPSPEREILAGQYKLMAYRLWYIITWPSAALTLIIGLSILFLTPRGNAVMQLPWMHVKFGLLILLYAYHFSCHRIFIKLQAGNYARSSNYLRIWNEGATLLLFAIIFVVVLKNALNWIFGVAGIILLMVFLMLGFKFYKRVRERNQS